jgi:DNA topoisomerase-1
MAWGSLDEDRRSELEAELESHELANPVSVIKTLRGEVIAEGTPVAGLVLPGGVAQLEIHRDALPLDDETARQVALSGMAHSLLSS